MRTRSLLKTALLTLVISSVGSIVWTGPASAQFEARIFALPNNEIHMASGSAQWCVIVEPMNGSFSVTDINACTVTLSSAGTGSVSSINYDCTKPALIGDADGNGVQDVRFCFLKTAMAPLFDNLHGASPKSVFLNVNGNLFTGGFFGSGAIFTLYLKS